MKIKRNIAMSDTGFLFNPNTGDSFSLNETGREIVGLMRENKNEQEIIKHFTEKYDADSSSIEQNLYDFLEMLKSYDILNNEEI